MRNLKNERGQATTAALILLPAVLVLFLGAVIFVWAFAIEAKATAACRVAMVQSQKEAAQALSELLALNKTAEALEQSRKAAEAGLVFALASANPVAIATARAALTAVQLAQKPVRMKQLLALMKGKRSSKMAHINANEAMREALSGKLKGNEAGSITGKFFAAISPDSKTARFEVIATPPGARTPTYRTAPRFNKSQEAKARWLLGLPSPEFLKSENENQPGASVEIGCAVTLEKTETGEWKPQMTEDRLLRN